MLARWKHRRDHSDAYCLFFVLLYINKKAASCLGLVYILYGLLWPLNWLITVHRAPVSQIRKRKTQASNSLPFQTQKGNRGLAKTWVTHPMKCCNVRASSTSVPAQPEAEALYSLLWRLWLMNCQAEIRGLYHLQRCTTTKEAGKQLRQSLCPLRLRFLLLH